MGLFGKKEEPVQTPPAEDPPQEEPKPEFVPKSEFDKAMAEIGNLKLQMESFGTPQPPAAPMPPAEDPGKKTQEEIAKIETELDSMDEAIDKAVFDGKGVGALMRRNSIEFNAFRDQGVYTLDKISEQVTSSQMPYLSVPEVKKAYDQSMAGVAAAQRMNPEVRIAMYNLAVGQNISKINEIEIQAALRKPAEDEPPASPGDVTPQSGRTRTSKGGEVPAIDEVLGRSDLDAIRAAGYRSPDEYYRKLGYEGWEDHYKKNKDYYEGEEA